MKPLTLIRIMVDNQIDNQIIAVYNPNDMQKLGVTETNITAFSQQMGCWELTMEALFVMFFIPFFQQHVDAQYKNYIPVAGRLIDLNNDMIVPVIEFVKNKQMYLDYANGVLPHRLVIDNNPDIERIIQKAVNDFAHDIQIAYQINVGTDTLDDLLNICRLINPDLIQEGFAAKYQNRYFLLATTPDERFKNTFMFHTVEYMGYELCPLKKELDTIKQELQMHGGQIIIKDIKDFCRQFFVTYRKE